MIKYIEITLVCVFSALIFNLLLYILVVSLIKVFNININVSILFYSPAFYILLGNNLRLGIIGGVLLWKVLRKKIN